MVKLIIWQMHQHSRSAQVPSPTSFMNLTCTCLIKQCMNQDAHFIVMYSVFSSLHCCYPFSPFSFIAMGKRLKAMKYESSCSVQFLSVDMGETLPLHTRLQEQRKYKPSYLIQPSISICHLHCVAPSTTSEKNLWKGRGKQSQPRE